MLKFLKRKKESVMEDNVVEENLVESAVSSVEEPTQEGLFRRLKGKLHKTRHAFAGGVGRLLLGRKTIDDELLEEIETLLLTADVSVPVVQFLMTKLTERLKRKQLADGEAVLNALQEDMAALLLPVEKPLELAAQHHPYVILTVGVNGAGKTTTIGKLAKRFQEAGKKVMLAAGDTFRAAAVEQLQVWGERNQIPVVTQGAGADSASVIYDALESAKARDVDVLIADTAGRLHTQSHLMEELKKIKRVMTKLDVTAPHEILLILDAGIGQNALQQAKQFNEAVGVSGIALTKLDGTAKGGMIFAIAKELNIPIRFIGVGEQIDDLKPFHAEEFVQALF